MSADVQLQGRGRGQRKGGRGRCGCPSLGVQVRIARGLRQLSILAEGAPVTITGLTVQQKIVDASPEKLALHYRLLGAEPGSEPLSAAPGRRADPARFLRKAYRRPVEDADVTPLLSSVRSRGGARRSFRRAHQAGAQGRAGQPEFPVQDGAAQRQAGHLSAGPVRAGLAPLVLPLVHHAGRRVDHARRIGQASGSARCSPRRSTACWTIPKARTFTSTFIGQWLGTQDLGGRVAPMLTELQAFYTPPVAADLRAEPVLIFERILGENRSLLELLNGNYTYMTERLVKFYQLEDQFQDVHGNEPQLVEWPDNRRAGIMNLGAVMAITSHYRQTSPVLRGAWVLDTLLGTPVPPPPPNVPALEPVKCLENCVEKAKTAVGMRQRILDHRANPACTACHNLMDPIGFALENFDWTGRWRDKEFDGSRDRRLGRAALGREVQRTGGTAPGADGPQGRLHPPADRQGARLRAGAQPAGWRQLHRPAAGGQAAEGQLPRADADPRSRAQHSVPEHSGRCRW